MENPIDLNFRPDSYFGPLKLEQYLLSKVKGAVVKTRIKELFSQGRHADVIELVGSEGISASDKKALEAIHPMFMGGNYLPDTEDGEVEVARISIASTTADVTCVYARPEDGRILLKVVDEYGGDTLTGKTELTAERPLTLGELYAFFIGAWRLNDLLEKLFEERLDAMLGFFSADSDSTLILTVFAENESKRNSVPQERPARIDLTEPKKRHGRAVTRYGARRTAAAILLSPSQRISLTTCRESPLPRRNRSTERNLTQDLLHGA